MDNAARSSVIDPSPTAARTATRATTQQMSTGIRVRRGTSASAASTGSTTPSHHGAPRSWSRPSPSSSPSGVGAGSSPPSSSSPSPAPCSSAGSHHGASSTGTTASATTGGPQADRSRPTPGSSVNASSTTTRPTRAATSQATGVPQLTRASSSPVRQAARQRRSDSGSAKPRAACPSQGSSAADSTRAMLPWPHAPETTGTTAYVVAPHRISQRFAPAGVASRPATRRKRQAPHSANGTASTSSADTAAAGLPPRTVASSAIGSTYGGAGTAVPSPSSCQDERCSDHQSLQSFGAGESPGPETCPSAERAPMSIASTVTASSTATGLVRKRATSPVSSTTSSSSSRSRSVVRRAANDDGSRSAAAARRRSATSDADWVSAVARSMTASRPCR